MYGVFARNSDLKAQQHAILNGRSMDSPLGSNNIGIKINDSSQLKSPNILLHGEGGNSKGLGQILDGVLVQNARLNASNKIDVVGYGSIFIQINIRGGKIGHIEDITVHPDFRKKGIG